MVNPQRLANQCAAALHAVDVLHQLKVALMQHGRREEALGAQLHQPEIGVGVVDVGRDAFIPATVERKNERQQQRRHEDAGH